MALNNKVNITINAKDNASKNFKTLEKNAWGLWSKLKRLGGPLKAIWIWLAASWAAAWVVGVKMFNLADNIETTMWKSKIVFGEYFDDMDKFAKETWKSMWLSRNEFFKTASWMQDLLIPMWFTREEASKLTKETIGLAGALSEWSAWKYSTAEAGEILTKAMLWEKEQLKAMWINVDISSEAYKKRIAVIQEDTWKTLEQAKAIDISRQIMEKSTDAQTAFKEWGESLTRKKAEMTATLQNLKETIATSLIPAFHTIVQTLQPIIEKVSKNIELWFQNKQNIDKLTTTIKTIIWVFWTLFKILGTAISWFYKLWEALWFAAFKVVEFVQNAKAKLEQFWQYVAWVWNSIKTSSSNVWWAIKWSILWIVDAIYNWTVWKFSAMIDKVSAIYNRVKWFLSWIFWAESKANASASRTQATQNRVASYTTPTYQFAWARANGWDVRAWHSYLVWERGSETFTPTQNWTITSNKNSWGGWVTLQFWDVNISNGQSERQFFDKVEKAMISVQRKTSLWF